MGARTTGQRDALQRFLAESTRPAGTLQYHQLQGFLFAVLSSPELIRPSEWMPIVFAESSAVYKDETEAQSVMSAMMSLYNAINSAILEGIPAMPPDCAFRDPPLRNLEPDAPVSQWAQGFCMGHDWLSKPGQRTLRKMTTSLECCCWS